MLRLKSLCCAVTVVVLASGCSRAYHRVQADRDVGAIIAQKNCEEASNWPEFRGIDVDPRSRFYDPSPIDCPSLPVAEPALFDYSLPPLASGNPNLKRDWEAGESDDDGLLEESDSSKQADSVNSPVTSEVRLAQLIRHHDQIDGDAEELSAPVDPQPERDSGSQRLRIVPIPIEFWEQLPSTCLPRMLEFESVRSEYRRSFSEGAGARIQSQMSDSPRLTLPMITELAEVNSRDLQTQRENLYRAALALTAQRYRYELRPVRFGNGSGVDYTHVRLDGTEQTGLAVPTGIAVTRTTATAGQFLASFANDVILTFNGSQGFSANIATELILDFQQTLFQRDVVFEDLTSAERNVVYAARDLIRFRRSLFVDLASQYYDLLLTYRAIEISSQDYFSNLRAFLQGRAEYLQAGRIPRVQVDQFEQNALGSRSSLVGDCNDLESSLDRLKLVIGLPLEMPLNLELRELEALTKSDELTVTRQLVVRTRGSLVDAAQGGLGDRNATINSAAVLVKRLRDSLRIRRQINGADDDSKADEKAEQLARRLALLEARTQGDQLEAIRQRELSSEIPPPLLIQFARTADLIDSRLLQAERAIQLRRDRDDQDDLQRESSEIEQAQDQLLDLKGEWDQAIKQRQFDQLSSDVAKADALLKVADELTARIVRDVLPQDDGEFESLIIQTVSDTVALVDQVETSDTGGLDEVEVATEEALLTALYERLDLMNVRGELADARRQIKLAADDLRSIVDIGVTHRLIADRNLTDSANTSADGNLTQVSFALDTPLNRRLQRNNYRAALIDYGRARRALIEREDEIKFAVRQDLRQLRLRRNQYEISVARAALAYERVVSTRLQLQLAVGNVVARDFLEAQQAYTEALNSVAADHISFILDRIELFFDTESIRLDSSGFWSGSSNDDLDLPPRRDFYDANPNPYGRLPACLRYSDEVRMNH